MNKLWIIVKREYLSKVKKKSFFVLTLLGPILMTLLIVLPVVLQESTKERYHVIVVDEIEKTVIEGDTISFFKGKFKSNENLLFEYSDDITEAQALLEGGLCDAVLEIANTNDKPPIKSFLFYGENEPGMDAKSDIKEQTKEIYKNSVLRVDYNMTKEDIKIINDPQIDFYTKDIRTGQDSKAEIKTVLGAVLGFVIYFFIFLFGGQVMRSVGEEKTSRIVEVLTSSVKSVYLLFGKIIAVALVGLTQIVLWIVLTLLLIGGVSLAEPDIFSAPEKQEIQVSQRVISVDSLDLTQEKDNFAQEIGETIRSINFPLIIAMFVVYFILGYFLYASLFGAVGALLDNDTDNSQFTLPVTVPMIFAMICVPMVMNTPTGSVAVWLSMIPLTSPVIMLVRIPFGVPVWQLVVSILSLLLFIAGAIWLAAKIYRTGILMYGKNLSWKEVIKWFKK
ncbi:MAG: ABC transporter permease [Bacteroidales bacterium]|nr:ABC transporter permease [Bacteroidales bacterium]